MLASSIRRVLFDGFYGVETSAMIFRIINHCNQLDSISIPWTLWRYGNNEAWSYLLRERDDGTALSSLELLAVDLKHTQIADRARQVDSKPWKDPQVDFGRLRRLKLSGSSNLLPIGDDDLVAISRTARLHELHITGTTAITTKGLVALCRSSKDTLRTLEHSPLSNDGFEHPNASAAGDGSHCCDEIIRMPHLSSLAVSLPAICEHLFSDTSIIWAGEVQIRAAGICGQPGTLRSSTSAQRALFGITARARSLIQTRAEKNTELNIEIFIGRMHSFLNISSR